MASEAAASAARVGGADRSAPGAQPHGEASDTANLTAILSAHWHLGYRPSEKLLVAMGPFVCRRAAQLTQQQKTDMAHLLLEFQFDPGPQHRLFQASGTAVMPTAMLLFLSVHWNGGVVS